MHHYDDAESGCVLLAAQHTKIRVIDLSTVLSAARTYFILFMFSISAAQYRHAVVSTWVVLIVDNKERLYVMRSC